MEASVKVVDYDSSWPLLFEGEKAKILSVIAKNVVAIEHVGSTAVPGLGAKPIIDIMVGIRHLSDAQGCIGPLETIGYEYVPEYENSIPERRYFRKGPQTCPTSITIYTWLNSVAIFGGAICSSETTCERIRTRPESIIG